MRAPAAAVDESSGAAAVAYLDERRAIRFQPLRLLLP
jgi:hypothetical protein